MEMEYQLIFFFYFFLYIKHFVWVCVMDGYFITIEH